MAIVLVASAALHYGNVTIADEFTAVEHQRKIIYHSPQSPGFTCWCGAWAMPDGSLMTCFTQATGPVEGRESGPAEFLKQLNWPPSEDRGFDMTGLELRNVHLRSNDAGQTWKQVSADSFRTCMNGATGEAEMALADGTVIRAVEGFYLPYDTDHPRTGYIQRSTDGTKSWGKAEQLLPPEKYSAFPKRIRQLRDGRLVIVGGVASVPANSRTRHEYSALFDPLLVVSSDSGKTWTGPIPIAPEEYRGKWGGEELDVAELANGNLLCVFRRPNPDGAGEVRWQGVMKKAGASWEPAVISPAPFPHSGHPELLATRDSKGIRSAVARSKLM